MNKKHAVWLAAGFVSYLTCNVALAQLVRKAKHRAEIEAIQLNGKLDILAIHRASALMRQQIEAGDYLPGSLAQLAEDFDSNIKFEKIAIREES